ncbi:LPS export ABC transporter periplasmic protein LptC [bacterium]|nr:LPS export ABC transporter periplasmic protein LptC [bacterium]
MRTSAAAFRIAAFAALALASSCSMPSTADRPAPAEERPDAVFTGFRREEVAGGVVTFVATAGRAEYFQDRGLLVVYDVSFEDRGKDGGSAKATGQADKVVYHEDTGDAECSGFVQIRSLAEDATFETASLNYRSATQTLEGASGDAVIVKVGKKLFIQGSGFFADIQSKAFAFREGASGVLAAAAKGGAPKGGER